MQKPSSSKALPSLVKPPQQQWFPSFLHYTMENKVILPIKDLDNKQYLKSWTQEVYWNFSEGEKEMALP